MDMITDAVRKMEEVIHGSGCQDSNIRIRRSPDADVCRYERGVPLVFEYGGVNVDCVTNYPLEATTRVNFMFGAQLDTPEKRTAACGIMNAIGRFLCLCRSGRACRPEDHAPCMTQLGEHLAGRKVFVVGQAPALLGLAGVAYVDMPGEADILLVPGDGLFREEAVRVVDAWRDDVPILLVGPSTAGCASFLGIDHWCPYSR
ncbi:hypothetical protein AZH53_10435 [Methanomicrobiaceae archaeon CYW5]|uniref:hypothetical protein n=1 Tax=Methanovulcanius yangii TaxID=1789227 RepID=UPI0029CA6E8E|nr:hypothetical protein [Methanovulcanius yangii]MBT8508822.1 hypothetical protein [Methanovulcanius yangii]